MSLINEALKKAQRQRTEDPVAVTPTQFGPVATPASRIVKRRPPMPARTQILLVGGCIALLLMGGALAFVVLDSESPAPPPTPPVVAVQPVAPPPPVAVVPEPETPPAPVEVAITLPPLPLPVAPIPTPPEPPPAAPLVPTPNPKVHEFLEVLRITGIRTSDTDPKVIMNDRVFRLNDIVDRGTQLRLLKIDSSYLLFVDANGFEYRKSF